MTLQVDDGLDRGALVGDARPETNDAYREKKLTLIHERDPMSDKAIGILIQGDSGGLRLGWVDLDLRCSTILLGQ